MIKYSGTRDGRLSIGFVLEPENIKRLKRGEPIYVDLALFDLDAELMIAYSSDIEKTARHLTRGIGPHTLVHNTRHKPKSN